MSKRYKVVGTSPITDNAGKTHAPGEEFSGSYGKTQEGFLLEIGALKVVDVPDKGYDKGYGKK